MRYSGEYRDWAERAERNTLPSDRERAAMTAAKIRNGHSGSALDSEQLARMERLAGYSSSDDWDDYKPRDRETQRAAPREPQAIPGMVEIEFVSDEFSFTNNFYLNGLDVALVERTVSAYLANRDDLDYSIHGFERGGRLSTKSFSTKVIVSDYDPDTEQDYNRRSIRVRGTIRQAMR